MSQSGYLTNKYVRSSLVTYASSTFEILTTNCPLQIAFRANVGPGTVG